MKIVSDYQYQQARLKTLFDMIAPEDNWKKPIRCVIPRYALTKFDEACKHFTGGSLAPTKPLLGVGMTDLIECTSEGYYGHIGA